MQPRIKIILAYLLVLGLGMALSFSIFLSGRQVSEATSSLVEQKLPRLQVINELYIAIVEHERLLYEYYATTDSDTILPQLQEMEGRFRAYFQQIELAFPNAPQLEEISYGDMRVRSLTQSLDENFKSERIDWDKAREQLVEVTAAGRQILPALDTLVAKVNQEAYTAGEETRYKTQLSTSLVIGFSLVIFVIASFVGYFVNRYIQESVNRRRLAMFAERSPNPIISFNWQGKLNYTNPACQQLMVQLNNHSNRPESLLPDDFPKILLALQKSSDNYSQWITRLEENCYIQYSLSLLRDLGTCHLYLEDITERTQAQSELKHQAYHDSLTELPNRRNFNENLQRLVEGNIQKKPFALILMHIDRFDLVTSAIGYQAGDMLIKETATRLNKQVQNFCTLDLSDKLYRLDSTKFALLLDTLPEHNFALNMAEELANNMSSPVCLSDQQFHLSISIGICHYPDHGEDGEALLANVDAALTRVKSDGGNGILEYNEDLHRKEQAWLAIERDLRQAIDKQQLELFYQPKILAGSHTISGVEALIRWRRDDGSMVSPAEFIPVAEQTGLIVTIGEWVIDEAFRQQQKWADKQTLNIAINLSAKQFQHPDFIDGIKRRILESDIDTSLIEMEITESLLMNDIDSSIRTMQQIKSMGFKLSIDDFGTGYSSLSYLKEFPINKLKIDRAFVMNIHENNDDKTLAKTIVDLAHNLDLSIVAEGVENEMQLKIIEELGCEEIQGFYFSKPRPAAEIEEQYLS